MSDKEDSREFIPVEEAARVLATTPLSVLMRLRRKVLEGREVEGRWFVVRESLERLQAEGSDADAEPLCRSHCTAKGGCSSCG